MRLFLDSSVLLSSAGSERSLSRLILTFAGNGIGSWSRLFIAAMRQTGMYANSAPRLK